MDAGFLWAPSGILSKLLAVGSAEKPLDWKELQRLSTPIASCPMQVGGVYLMCDEIGNLKPVLFFINIHLSQHLCVGSLQQGAPLRNPTCRDEVGLAVCPLVAWPPENPSQHRDIVSNSYIHGGCSAHGSLSWGTHDDTCTRYKWWFLQAFELFAGESMRGMQASIRVKQVANNTIIDIIIILIYNW